jgi:hypothetical protein
MRKKKRKEEKIIQDINKVTRESKTSENNK